MSAAAERKEGSARSLRSLMVQRIEGAAMLMASSFYGKRRL
jgi:hypothetical protein